MNIFGRNIAICLLLVFMILSLSTSRGLETVDIFNHEAKPEDRNATDGTSETYTKENNLNNISVAQNREEQKEDEDEPEPDMPEDMGEEENIKEEKPLSLSAVEDPESLKTIRFQVMDRGELVDEYYRRFPITFGDSSCYSDIEGVTCFRGNNYRNSASYGNALVEKEELEIIWRIPVGGIDKWTGVGWNGQPAIVKWPREVKKTMNIFEEKKGREDLKEVIYAALDGKVYFLDAEDGVYTRETIQIPGPVKGSVTVDPRGFPLLYVGQGINKVNGKLVEMGYRIYSLIDQKKLYFINGSDRFAYRGWPAFDSTALIDKNSDSMILGGENGLFYTARLNTIYNKEEGSISVNPELTKYRYEVVGNKYQGIENSTAIYRNYAYFCDNGGSLQCIDLNTLKPLWVRDVTDDTDSTIVLEEERENGCMVLYTACEVDKQGSGGNCYIRKLDALTGRLIWEKSYPCYSKGGKTPVDGGAFATPVVGKGENGNMVIFNLSRYGTFNGGRLVALDKETGEELWDFYLEHYSWSSPIDIYSYDGKAYIIVCDTWGNMFLLEGKTGQVLNRISLKANVEGSPAVFENTIVVGTRGQEIYGIKIK